MKATDLGLLIIRLALGAVFVMHGLGKFFPDMFGGGGGIEGFATFLTNLGVPQPKIMAFVTAGWEVAGGAAIALGIFPRIAALGLLGIMVVSIIKVHLPNGFFTFPPGVPQIGPAQLGYELNVALGSMALAILLAGPGKIALLPEGKLKGKKKPG